MLPCFAFAAGSLPIDGLFFTPPATDYSMSAMQSIFGTVGNVLPGRGNQLFGTLIGIFNACWIVAIGIGVLFVLWDSVMHAAQSGEAMAGHGKKTAMKIIAIVLGFGLAVPSSTTGYSLAQSGVLWLAKQGVGIADHVYEKMYDHFNAGGVVVTTDPPKASDMQPLLDPASAMLKAQICMYKLQDIKLEEKKRQAAIDESLGNLPSYSGSTDPDAVGYSINRDATLTVGTLNTKYVASSPTSHAYNDECGKIVWEYKSNVFLDRMRGSAYSPEQAAEERASTLAYIKAATTEMFNGLAPVARQIAAVEVDTAKNPDASKNLKDLIPSGVDALASSSISFATILDPIRRQSLIGRESSLNAMMADYRSKGWVFTPFMMMVPGLYAGATISVSNYMPIATPPDLARITDFSADDITKLSTLIGRVDSDDYVGLASKYLDLHYANNSLPADLAFSEFLKNYNSTLCIDPQTGKPRIDPETGEVIADCNTGDVDSVVDYIEMGIMIPKNALIGAKYATGGIMASASGFLGGINAMIGAYQGIEDYLGRGKGCLDEVLDVGLGGFSDCKTLDEFNMGDGLQGITDAQESIAAATKYAENDLQSALDAMNDLVAAVNDSIAYAKKGGMNNQLKDLTSQIGPIGPIMAVMLTSMVGKGFSSLEEHAGENQNAMVTSIRIGGDMMVASLQSIFTIGKVFYISSLAEAALSGVGSLFSSAPVKFAAGLPGGALGIANKGMGLIVPMYVTLSLFFFAGGMLLFIMVPLTWLLLFGAVVLRWFGMLIVLVLASPIFCFNMIRADTDGLIGKGDRFLGDLARTIITPVILILGAVAFLVLFDVAFQLISYLLTNFIPLLFKIKAHPYLVSVSLASILLVFGMLMLYVSNLLGNMCTTDLVNAAGSAIDHALHEAKGAQGLHEQAHHGMGGVSEQTGAASKGLSVDKPQTDKQAIGQVAKAVDETREAEKRRKERAAEKKQQKEEEERRRKEEEERRRGQGGNGN